MKYYYLMISDAIYAAKNGGYKHDWQFKFGYIFFILMFLNVNTIMILFDLDYNLFQINFGHSKKFNSRLNAFLHTGPPIILFNYYFIFYKDRYKEIEKKYPHNNKKIFIWYATLSLLIGFGTWFLQNWTKGILNFWV